MGSEATWASRTATGGVAGLAALHLLAAVLVTDDAMERGTNLLLGVILVAAAFGIARGNRFEARLAAVVVCVLELAALVLQVTVGPPGEAREPFGVAHAAAGILAATVLVTILIDARARRGRSPDDPGAPPYAL